MPRILVVEDNASVLEEVVYGLEMSGFQVVQATNGRAALDYLESARTSPDIIVSDISMPEMTGYQLLEQVQKRWADIPFIFLTAYASHEDVRTGKQLGADDYIVKPFEVKDLIIAIENKLRRLQQWRSSTSQQIQSARQELLTLIQGEVGILQSDIQLVLEDLEALPSEFSYKALDAIKKQTYSINRLVKQIVLLTKMDRGYFKQYYEEQAHRCKLYPIIEMVCETLKQEFAEDKVSFHYEQNEVSVVGLAELLALIFNEVLRNALLFSSNEQTVAISVKVNQQVAVIKVVDRGMGIAEKNLPHVWDRFNQFYRTGKPQQGAGLGLAVAYQCLRLHGGNATIESRPNVGTIVTLYLPTP
jgi:two-component system, sensor histidine kinase and response regulator